MPLLKGKENIGHNIKVEEQAGKPKAQAEAIALRTAGVPKAKDAQPQTASVASSGLPGGGTGNSYDSRSHNGAWGGRRV